MQGQGGGESDLATRCNTAGAIEKYDDCYLVKVYNEVNEVWTDEFARGRRGRTTKPGLTFFTQAVNTGCGQASSQVGPFYCPPDQTIYIDIGFLHQLQQQFGAQGRYAQAYILAHEAGHHLQTLFGTERQVRAAQQSDPSKQNELSMRHRAAGGLLRRRLEQARRRAGQRLGRRRRGRSRPRTPPRRSATTGSSSRPRAGSTPSPGPTARPRSASSGSPPAARTGDVNACDTFRGLMASPTG